jgi:hypothetical protein
MQRPSTPCVAEVLRRRDQTTFPHQLHKQTCGAMRQVRLRNAIGPSAARQTHREGDSVPLNDSPRLPRPSARYKIEPCEKWRLAYIGTAANKKLGDELCAYPRRFRLGGKKEAAGVCRGRGESMEFQSQTADTERVVTLLDKAGEAISSGPWPQYMPQLQRPRRLRLRSCRRFGQE